MRYLAFLTLLCLLGPGITAKAQDSEALAQLIAEHKEARTARDADFAERRETLVGQYRDALTRLGTQYQEAGSLEGQLGVREEMEAPGKGSEGPEELAELRAVFLKSSGELDDESSKFRQTVDLQFADRFEALKVTLVKAGDIEAAVKANELAVQLKAEGAGMPSSEGTPAPRLIGQEAITDSILYTQEKITGSHELGPGIYEYRERIVLGDAKIKDKEERRGEVSTDPGADFKEIEWLIDEGSLTAEGSLFTGGRIMIDLGGSLTAEDTIFDRTILSKGGAWSVKWFSAKWTLSNCVLHRTFITPMRNRSNGVSMENCTIIGATISKNEYYENPVDESGHEWRTIKRCHFIDCEIPESVLLATEDCLFENCRFIPDISETKPERSASVSLYVEGLGMTPPPGNDRVTFELEDRRSLKQPVGASIDYEISAGVLRFR